MPLGAADAAFTTLEDKQVQAQVVKGKHQAAAKQKIGGAVKLPPALQEWVEYRKQIRKPLKPVTITKLKQQYDKDPAAFAKSVEYSILNGYQGLFAPKEAEKKQKPKKRRRDEMEVFL